MLHYTSTSTGNIMNIMMDCVGYQFIAGLEAVVQLVRFWPDHYLQGAHPLLLNAWDWKLQRNALFINTSLERKFSSCVLSAKFY